MDVWPKRCICGASYEEVEWEHLRYVGIQRSNTPLVSDIELRTCTNCTSTLSVTAPSVLEVDGDT